MNDSITKTVNILRSGGIILYPTDTFWGIGCDATNPDAVAKVYQIKKSADSRSMFVLIDKVGRIPSYVSEMPDLAWDLIDLSDKPLTIIYPKAKNLAPNLVAADGTIGIQVTNHEFCSKLIGRLGKPLVYSYADISGKSFPKSFYDIEDAIKEKIDFIVPDEFDQPLSNKPTGIIKLGLNGEIQVIRE